MESFAKRFKMALDLRDKTRADVARATDISPSSITEYYNGTYKPNSLRTYIIANYLRVNPAWLMGVDTDIESANRVHIYVQNLFEIGNHFVILFLKVCFLSYYICYKNISKNL